MAEATSAVSAESVSWAPTPTRASTVKRSQTSSWEWTVRGAVMVAASARLVAISSGRRRTRSVSVPMSGPSKAGTQAHTLTSAARLLEPVSSLTQTPHGQ